MILGTQTIFWFFSLSKNRGIVQLFDYLNNCVKVLTIVSIYDKYASKIHRIPPMIYWWRWWSKASCQSTVPYFFLSERTFLFCKFFLHLYVDISFVSITCKRRHMNFYYSGIEKESLNKRHKRILFLATKISFTSFSILHPQCETQPKPIDLYV